MLATDSGAQKQVSHLGREFTRTTRSPAGHPETTGATQNGPPVRSSLDGVLCTTPTACTAVGVTAIQCGGRPLVDQWAGVRWTPKDAG